MQNFLGILYGLVFGVANIIPGVSGGTMLVTFGCYDKVCGALALDFKEIKRNLKFLIFFAIGAVLGIVGFSNVISLLFEHFPTQTYMFFMGLIIGSVPLIIRNATVKEKFRPICAVPFLIALALVVSLAVLEGGDQEQAVVDVQYESGICTVTFTNNSGQDMESWKLETDDGGMIISVMSGDVEFVHRGGKTEAILSIFGVKSSDKPNTIVPAGDTTLKAGDSVTFRLMGMGTPEFTAEYSYRVTFMFIAVLVLASMLAAVAMIIPGVSGSFIMVLLGTYATVISAVKDFNFAVLIPTAIGVILGLVFGARLIRFLLKRFRLMVFSAILGLCAGSLYAILPDGFGLNFGTAFGGIALVAGAAISFIVGKHTKTEE